MKTKKPGSKSAGKTWLLILGAFCVCLLLWDFVSGSGKAEPKASGRATRPQPIRPAHSSTKSA